MLVGRGGCVCPVPSVAQPGSGGSSAAGHCSCCWQAAFPPPLPDSTQLARGCCRALPSLCSCKVLVGLLEPVAMPEAHSTSAELASGPPGTTVTHKPLGGLCLFRCCGVSPGLCTSGIGSEQVSHLPETVVGIQGPFLSLAPQHGALQSMWG